MAYQWLVKDWKKLFPALEQAATEEEVKRLCEDEIAEWRKRPTLKKESSLRVPMGDTRAEIKTRLAGDKQVWALKYLQFSEAEWIVMNAGGDEAIQERHENQQFIKDPDAIVAKGTELLASEQWPEIAVGLAVCTGRRLTEVLKTAAFELKTAYSVKFSGQLKAKGEVTFEIPTLAPAAVVIEAVTRLRALLNTTDMEGRDVSHKYSQPVREATQRHFSALVPTRSNHDELYTHMCRSIYARIAVLYYCPMNVTDIHFMATVQGHYRLLEISNETDRRNYASSATHYYDYRLIGPDGNLDGRQGIHLGAPGVELLEVFKPKKRKEKPMITEIEIQEPKRKSGSRPVTVQEESFNRVVALRGRLGHRTYDDTVALLLDTYEQGGRAVDQSQLTPESLVPAATAAAIREAMLISGEENFMTFLVDALSKEAKFRTSLSKRHADKDFATLGTKELLHTKHPDASKERIRRAVVAVAAYNDKAVMAERWFINPRTIQQLSGARYPLVEAYFKEHQSEIDAHNVKHALTQRYNSKAYGIKTVVVIPEEA